MGERAVDERRKVGVGADVAWNWRCLQPFVSKLQAGGLAARFVIAGDNDLRAGARHFARNGEADAAMRSGDDRRPAFKREDLFVVGHRSIEGKRR